MEIKKKFNFVYLHFYSKYRTLSVRLSFIRKKEEKK